MGQPHLLWGVLIVRRVGKYYMEGVWVNPNCYMEGAGSTVRRVGITTWRGDGSTPSGTEVLTVRRVGNTTWRGTGQPQLLHGGGGSMQVAM